MEGDQGVAIATVFVRNEGELLVVRPDEGRWNGLSLSFPGEIPGDEALRNAVAGVTGLDAGGLSVVRRGDPVTLTASVPVFGRSDGEEGLSEAAWTRSEADSEGSGSNSGHSEADSEGLGSNSGHSEVDSAEEGDERQVRPVLIDSATRLPSELTVESEWVHAPALRRRATVSGLWDRYDRVAPTVRSIAADDEHGAATLSIHALEVLRDRAALLVDEGESDAEELTALARRLLRARPSMAVVRNRLARVLADADDPEVIETAATEGIERAAAADRAAAFRAAGVVDSATVLTLSRSSTVLETLGQGTAERVFVAESRPAREGIGVAETLAEGCQVTVHTDAAVAHLLATVPIDAVLVGADTVLPDGSVVNKTGTRGAALAAANEDVPVYAAAAADKITTRESVNLESGDVAAVYDGEAPLDVRNPTFDVTPATAIEGVVTERGVLDPEAVSEIAAELQTAIDAAGL